MSIRYKILGWGLCLCAVSSLFSQHEVLAQKEIKPVKPKTLPKQLSKEGSVTDGAIVKIPPEDALHPGYTSLFNGEDFTGWKVPEGDNGHWKVVEGVIDYDAQSEAKGDKNLWTEKEYGDFILSLEWRIKETTGLYKVPIVLADGSELKDAKGNVITVELPNADSGIYLRGTPKAQVNIWCWPIGSGEVYSYRRNQSVSPEVRAGVTPKTNADKPVGEWNKFIIIMVKDRLTVILNNEMVLENAQLPDVPEKGPIAFQHHGGKLKDGTFSPASGLMQFRNIYIKELD